MDPEISRLIELTEKTLEWVEDTVREQSKAKYRMSETDAMQLAENATFEIREAIAAVRTSAKAKAEKIREAMYGPKRPIKATKMKRT